MPDMNGLEAARRIRKSCPKTEVVILSVHYTDMLVREIVDSGAKGYILKSEADKDLVIVSELIRYAVRNQIIQP
jgi:DNA-binding NarL/FixJ family response regulator